MSVEPSQLASPRITGLKVSNYRALRDVELADLTPLTALLGPNGSGKSTLLDVVEFVHDAVTDGLPDAWRGRGGAAEVRSFGSSGLVEIELTCALDATGEYRYRLALDEDRRSAVTRDETLVWKDAGQDVETPLLDFHDGNGIVYEQEDGTPSVEQLRSAEILAVSTFGQLKRHPRILAFQQFVAGVRSSRVELALIHMGAEDSGRQSLTPTAHNLAGVVEYLLEEHPDTFAAILTSLRQYVPNLADVNVQRLPSGQLTLRIKDDAFDRTSQQSNVSDGTLKLLAYLIALRAPERDSVLTVEEPENHLHPRLLQLLAEDAGAATEHGQVLIATHSPYFVNALRPEQVWMTYRGTDGYTRVHRAADLRSLVAMYEAGGLLGSLWTEGYFDMGDPLTRAGRPK